MLAENFQEFCEEFFRELRIENSHQSSFIDLMTRRLRVSIFLRLDTDGLAVAFDLRCHG